MTHSRNIIKISILFSLLFICIAVPSAVAYETEATDCPQAVQHYNGWVKYSPGEAEYHLIVDGPEGCSMKVWRSVGSDRNTNIYFDESDLYPNHADHTIIINLNGLDITNDAEIYRIGHQRIHGDYCNYRVSTAYYCDSPFDNPYSLSINGDVSPSSPTTASTITLSQTSVPSGYHYGWLTYFVDGQAWPESYQFYGWNETNTSAVTWGAISLPAGDYQLYSGFSLDNDGTVDISDYTSFTVTQSGSPLAVNVLEKYSNAALVNQAVTVSRVSDGANETKTSLYGETLHFYVDPYTPYWFNATRPGYHDYNETYLVPATPGIYTLYMERTLTPIANHSYAHFSVVDQTNGGLIPNAEIRLSDGQTKLTNSAGYSWFSVNNSEQINYYVSRPSGYWPAYGAFNITSDESIVVALQRYTGPTATQTLPGWTPITVTTTGSNINPVQTLSAQLRQQNVQEGMDVWYTNLPFISQFLFLLFIIGGLGLMAGGTRRN